MKQTYTIAFFAIILSVFAMTPAADAGDVQQYEPPVVPVRLTNSLLARTVPGKRLYLFPGAGASGRPVYGYYDAKPPLRSRRGVIQTRVPVKFVDIRGSRYRHRPVRRIPGFRFYFNCP